MAHSKGSKSAAVRARLDHPVIDGDGHWLEPIPIFLDYLRETAGAAVVDKFVKRAKDSTWYDLTPEERMRRRLHRPTWWGEPAGTLDRATAMVPRLFYERLDDFGIETAEAMDRRRQTRKHPRRCRISRVGEQERQHRRIGN